MTGVYFLFYKKKLVYIGKTECWPVRLHQHGQMKFDDARLLECPASKVTEYEARLIRILRPKFNIAYTNKVSHCKIQPTWIIANNEMIRESILNNGTECVKAARKKFKYSPRYGKGDLLRTITNTYCKLYNVWYDYETNEFAPMVYKKKAVVNN